MGAALFACAVSVPQGTHPAKAAVQVRTLFFASLRDLTGTGESVIELPEGSSVADLLTVLGQDRAELAAMGAAAAVAVNQVYSGPDTILSEGDEVAFIPPVAGG